MHTTVLYAKHCETLNIEFLDTHIKGGNNSFIPPNCALTLSFPELNMENYKEINNHFCFLMF